MILEPRGEVALTEDQTRVLMALTRTASVLSGLGVITIIATFSFSRHFRNPMHRLIFINAFYNAFDVTCTMISVSGPQAGNKSALCQFQGFLNQMFPVADVYWTLVMAIDVYLIVFRCYDTESLRKLEWKYIVGISTLTFIPALALLLIDTPEKGPMYGSVTIWCAIAPKWVLFRIVIYYVPIWSSIVVIIILYCMVGIEIIKRRRALKSITTDSEVFLDDAVLPAEEPVAAPAPSSRSITHTSHGSTDGSVLTTKQSLNHLNPPKRSSLSFRQYVLMPLFFFLALLTVWVAPSTNRVATFADPSFASFPLIVTVGVTGSLRGFWNALVFVAVGMKSWKRRKEEEEIALHPTTSDHVR
ncbi:hypothetical protein QBC34DRAFT_304352 [Podospora aff. communis PSN243]|uniref:G-protein coupled receptors family 2 profile 2 domain-containing protein n=1 Tax=Podospora aff. communis PSN243 TaxID=3040156 RepID=A0AAV9GEV9_9PEZI|nr:hypothetical protein QBC34DRAFT_304352 [Podospora aff. communis PSN243]